MWVSAFKQPSFLLRLFLLGVFLTIAYSPTFQATYLIDDKEFFLNDPVMDDPAGLFEIWWNPLNNNHVWPYLPVTRATFWIERQLVGVAPIVSHGVNVGFHLLGALLLWGLLRQMRFRLAWWVAMAVAVHPIYVQSVAWVVERKNVVAGVFFLMALWSFVRFEQQPYTRRREVWYVLALVLFLGGLLSKTSLIMLPFLLILVRCWLEASWKTHDVLRLIPFFGIAFGIGLLRVWFELNAFGVTVAPRGFLEKWLTAGHVPFFYLSKLVFPVPLVFTYLKWTIDPTQLTHYLPWTSVMLTTGLLAWKYRSWGRSLFFVWVSFGILLFPVMGWFTNAWTQFSYVADHWGHLPSIPLLIGGVSACGAVLHLFSKAPSFLKTPSFPKISSSLKTPFSYFSNGIGGLSLLILAWLTWNQTQLYQNPQTLWQSTVNQNPRSWVAYQELGNEAVKAGQYEQAVAYSTQALALKPDLFRAYNNRGSAHLRMQNYQQAFQDYQEALRIYPSFVEGYYNQGNVYFQLQQYETAIANYTQALTRDPQYVDAYYNRATSYMQLRQFESALNDLNHVIQLRPHATDAYYLRGNLHSLFKQPERALSDYQQVLARDPNHAGAYHSRGFLQLTQRLDPERGCLDLQQACRLGMCQYYQTAQQQGVCQ